MRLRDRVTSTLAVLLLVTGCGDETPQPRVEVDATVQVCAHSGSCTSEPAAGAGYELAQGDTRLRRGRLDAAGLAQFTVDPGSYTLRVDLEGHATESLEIAASEGQTLQVSVLID